MIVELQMVGAYQNTNKSFKSVPFVNGRASLVCADEHVAGICRYLQQFGAYPLVEAEVLQAKLDKDAGKKVSKKVALDRVSRHRAALRQAEAELADLDGIDGQYSDPGVAEAEPVAATPEPISRRPAARVVQPDPDPEPAAAPEPTPEPVAAAPAADIESEFKDGGSSDQEVTRRERSETPVGGKSSGKARKGGK